MVEHDLRYFVDKLYAVKQKEVEIIHERRSLEKKIHEISDGVEVGRSSAREIDQYKYYLKSPLIRELNQKLALDVVKSLPSNVVDDVISTKYSVKESALKALKETDFASYETIQNASIVKTGRKTVTVKIMEQS